MYNDGILIFEFLCDLLRISYVKKAHCRTPKKFYVPYAIIIHAHIHKHVSSQSKD